MVEYGLADSMMMNMLALCAADSGLALPGKEVSCIFAAWALGVCDIQRDS